MRNKKVSLSLVSAVLIILLWLSACSQMQPKANCPILNSNVTILGGATEAEIEQAILDYLNQGGSPERVQTEIKKLQETSILGPTQGIIVDTNGDGIKEIVLANNFDPPEGGDYMDVHGNLHIYECADGKYDDIQIIAGEFADTLKILAVENLLGSEVSEILITRRWTYLDRYYEFVEMYRLTEEGWVSSFKSEETQCGIETELKDGSNGHKELVIMVSNDCSESVDGLLTGKKWIYEFEENEVKLIQEGASPSP